MEIHIQYKKNIPFGYIGMNKKAALQHNIPWNHNGHTIEIKEGLSKSVRKATIAHEKIENYLMEEKHQRYKRAHTNALRFENLGIPFPSTNIKNRLKKVNFDII